MPVPKLVSLRQILFVVLIALFVPLSAAAADGAEMGLEIRVIPELQRYKEFLAYPAYLAVILDNNGLSPSLSHRASLTSAHSVRFGNTVLRFVEKTGAMYHYEAGLSLNLGVTATELKFPVVVDTAAIGTGLVVVKFSAPLSKVIPSEFIDRVQLKAQLLANVPAQKKVYAYLERLSMTAQPPGSVAALFESILMDAYNQSATSVKMSTQYGGETFNLSDQWAFMLALVAWIVVVSVVALAKRRRNAAKSID